MRILFLSRWYPYPPDNGSKLRVLSLLQGLSARHEVSLVSFADPAEAPGDPSAWPPAPVETRICPFREFQPRSGRAVLGYMSPTPRFLVDTCSAPMERAIKELVGTRRFDVVIASQIWMAAYHRCFAGIPAIFDEVELGSYRPSPCPGDTAWSRLRRGITWAKHRRFLAQLLPRFSLCTVASDVERELLAEAVPGWTSVHVVPNSIRGDAGEEHAGEKDPYSLIFTGSLRYQPNRDAITWFLREIFPAVRAACPAAVLTVTGETGPGPVPTAENVVLTGRVANVRPLVARSAVSLAPIRAGGGTRLKVLEAMAVRTPIVATRKAVEGLHLVDGEHLLVADTPAAFADAVRRILQDPSKAAAMAERAWRFFHARYDERVVVPRFLDLVDRAGAA